MATQALAVQENGKQQQTSLSLDIRQVEAQIQQFVPVLREIVTNGKKLNDEQIRGRAMFAITHGLDPVTEVHTITDGNGRTMAHTMAIDGYRRKCQEQVGFANEIQLDFVELDPAQLKKYGNVLIGYECRLRDGASYTQWQKRLREVGDALRAAMGGPVSFQDLMSVVGQPPTYTGVGLFYANELSDYKDKNFNPIERCKKRAEVNARKKRFPTNASISEDASARTIIDDGSVEVIDAPVETKRTRTDIPGSADAILGQLYGEPVQAAVFRPEPEPEPAAEIEPAAEPETIMDAAAELGATVTEQPEESQSESEPPAFDVTPNDYWKYILQERKMPRDWGLSLLEKTGGAFAEALALAKKTR